MAHGSQRLNGCRRHRVNPHSSTVKVYEVTVLKNLNYLDQKQPIDHQTYCSRSPAKDLAKAREAIHYKASRYYRSLWTWFIGTGAANFFFGSIGAWATGQHGWQAKAVEWASNGAAVLCAFTLIMLGALIYGWRKSLKGALGSASLWEEDPELFQQIYRDAIGPIPWTK